MDLVSYTYERDKKKWWLSVSQILHYCYDEYWIKSFCLFLQPLPSDLFTRRAGILEVGVLPIHSFRSLDQSTAAITPVDQLTATATLNLENNTSKI